MTRPPPPGVQWPDPAFLAVALVALLAVVVVVALVARLWVGALRGRRDWRLLDQVAPELVGQADETAILRIALADAPTMFRCRRVEVRLLEAGHRPALIAVAQADTDEPVDVGVATAQPISRTVVRYPLLGPAGHIGFLLLDGCSHGGRRARDRIGRAFTHILASSLGAARALGEERRLVEKTEEWAAQDELTTLGNRWLLDQWGDHLLTLARSQGKTGAVLLLDADDFKQINDTLGHAGGDRVLAEMGRRVRRSVRDSDLAVRLGGDEFAVLTGDLHSAEDAELLAMRLLEELSAPVVVDDVELAVQASIGIAVSGEDGDSLEALLRAADEAMYAAKAAGTGQWRRATADPELRPRSDRERIAADLRDGRLEENLVLHYQAQVDSRTGEVVGFEALARWQHPELGLLTPAEFVPVAERSGFMRELTSTVLGRALIDRDVLQSAVAGVRVAINVSARNLLAQGLVAELSGRLEEHHTPAVQLTLEVAEPAAGAESSVAEVFGQVEELGCRISVSEYGTGQSSLTALARLPGVREIKVSPGLVAQIPDSEASQRLVRAITTAAHSLRVQVVAEGVESLALAQQVRALGCDVLQGYHISPPAPLEEVVAWVSWWSVQRVERLALDHGGPFLRPRH